MSGGHYTPAGFAKTSDGTPGQAQLDDNGNLKVNVATGSLPLPTGAATEATLSAINDKIHTRLAVNNTLPLDSTATSAFTGLAGFGSVLVRIACNTFTGPVVFTREVSFDASLLVWVPVSTVAVSGSLAARTLVMGESIPALSSANTNETWAEIIPLGYGVNAVRYRVVSPVLTAGAAADLLFTAADTALPVGVTVNQGNPTTANPNSWAMKITDGSTGPVVVKSGGVAAANLDRALVVRTFQLPTTVGQTTMAASLPITVASDQSALPISAAALPLPTDAATDTLQTVGNGFLASIDSKLPSAPTAGGGLSVDSVGYSTNLDFLSGANPVYIGSANPASLSSDPVWQIRKLTYDGSDNLTNIQYAAGTTAFTSIWDNRAVLSYS